MAVAVVVEVDAAEVRVMATGWGCGLVGRPRPRVCGVFVRGEKRKGEYVSEFSDCYSLRILTLRVASRQTSYTSRQLR